MRSVVPAEGQIVVRNEGGFLSGSLQLNLLVEFALPQSEVHLISEIINGDIYRISGPYFTIVYSIKFQQICYEKYGFQKT